eukprot:15546818-Heterocapsa_arctica.AAC.1
MLYNRNGAQVDTQLGRRDVEAIKVQLALKSKVRCVPYWSCPRILWAQALGVRSVGSSAFTSLLEQFCSLVRSSNTAPVQWMVGQAAKIPKGN